MTSSSAAFALAWGSTEAILPRPPPRLTQVWDEDRNHRLAELWEEGLSAAEIGRELGCTRNAILGKKFRLGLPDRPPSGPSGERKVRPTQQKLPKPPNSRPRFSIHHSEPVPEPPPLENAVSIIDLEEHHCRYPAGYGEDHLMRYCGAPKEAMVSAQGTSSHPWPYCVYHNRLSYNRNARY